MGKRPAEGESFEGNMGSIQREDSAFYAMRRTASHGNRTRTNSSEPGATSSRGAVTALSDERSAGKLHATFCGSCALKAHGVQSPEMGTAAKPSSQPRTESCVVATTALRSVDREVVGRNDSERQDSPEIERNLEVADPISQRGRQNPRMRHGECPEMLPGLVPLACNRRIPWEQGRAVRFKLDL
jgi:hypothetical protein